MSSDGRGPLVVTRLNTDVALTAHDVEPHVGTIPVDGHEVVEHDDLSCATGVHEGHMSRLAAAAPAALGLVVAAVARALVPTFVFGVGAHGLVVQLLLEICLVGGACPVSRVVARQDSLAVGVNDQDGLDGGDLACQEIAEL